MYKWQDESRECNSILRQMINSLARWKRYNNVYHIIYSVSKVLKIAILLSKSPQRAGCGRVCVCACVPSHVTHTQVASNINPSAKCANLRFECFRFCSHHAYMGTRAHERARERSCKCVCVLWYMAHTFCHQRAQISASFICAVSFFIRRAH